MALVLGSSEQLAAPEFSGSALSGRPYVARSGVYVGEIESAVLTTRFASSRERQNGIQSVQCVHLGILATLETDKNYAGQLWVDADIGAAGRNDHLTHLCFITGNVRQTVDQAGRSSVHACLEDRVEMLSRPNSRGETTITTFPGLVGKKVLVAVSRYGESSTTGQPKLYLKGFFSLDGRSAIEQRDGLAPQSIEEARARYRGSEPLWNAPPRERPASKPYGSGVSSAYGQGVQPPQGYQTQGTYGGAASSQTQGAYGGAAMSQQQAAPYEQMQSPAPVQTAGQAQDKEEDIPF